MIAILVLLCALSCWAAWLDGFEAGKRKQRRDSMNADSKTFIRALTKVMEVQADGGDSAEDYVAWAVLEARRISKQ